MADSSFRTACDRNRRTDVSGSCSRPRQTSRRRRAAEKFHIKNIFTSKFKFFYTIFLLKINQNSCILKFLTKIKYTKTNY